MRRCWSCQAYLDSKHETEDGLYCPNCLDEATAADLELNGYKYTGSEWYRKT